MTERKEKHKLKQKERGITLIALVITIIVLLILAGVALSALTGDSGILNNAESAKIQTNHTSVAEGMKLKMGEYQIEKRTNGYEEDFMTFLKENADGAIVDDNGVINVKKLLGRNLSTGNGSNLTDVYILEEVTETAKLASIQMVKISEADNTEKSYTVKYYATETAVETIVETLGKQVALNEQPTDPEQPAETDSKYFEFEYDDTVTPPTATLKGINPDYMPEYTYLDPDDDYAEKLMKAPAYIKIDETSKITNIVIPNTVKKGDITYTITAIANSAFEITGFSDATSEIESVIIPNTVKRIGTNAFSTCAALTNVTIPDGITSIENGTFLGCGLLTNVTIPEGVTSIGDKAFYYCRALTNVTIPEEVTSIGEYAFGDCRALTKVTIPEGVISIGRSAFANCIVLEDIKIPNTLESLGGNAFGACESLTSITVPDGITEIGNNVFSGCKALETIEIPVSVTKIVSYAFYGDSELKTVYYSGTKAQWSAITIEMLNDPLKNANIICSDGTIQPQQ